MTGYYVPGTGGLRFFPLNPGRRLDGRPGINIGLAGGFTANTSRELVVDGHLAVPVGASAITGNLTVTGQTTAGFAAMTPDPDNNPSTSTLNFPVGDNRANGVTVPLNASGNTSLVYKAPSGTTYLIEDPINGLVPRLQVAAARGDVGPSAVRPAPLNRPHPGCRSWGLATVRSRSAPS